MDDSPFRRIVLPALLAASAGFAILTGPLASAPSPRLINALPQPLDRWLSSALVTSQYKEFSIRYVGGAILLSVAIGVGTAGVMRRRQTKLRHQQALLRGAIAAAGDRPPPEDAVEAIAATPPSDLTDEDPTVDWSGLWQRTPNPVVPESNLAVAVLSTPMEAHDIYQIQDIDQHCCLALKMGDEFYRFYRQRTGLDKTQGLVRQLQGRGLRAIATRDGSGYVVWVHQPGLGSPVSPWPAHGGKSPIGKI